MSITKEAILTALKEVNDPDLKKDLVTLGMIQNIKIDGSQVAFDVVLTTPACPLKELIKKDCEGALERHFGTDIEVNINMTSTVTIPSIDLLRTTIAIMYF